MTEGDRQNPHHVVIDRPSSEGDRDRPHHVVIDRGTKVGWGILVVLLGIASGGALAAGKIVTDVENLGEIMVDVRKAIDRNTSQLRDDGKLIAVLQSVVDANTRRIEKLEESSK